ncbi:hypothetical protein H310_01757 [Aphanomyces invadans]|uniref:RING-type domain-containing protein n=1 Tax=Aphanomyces invadans TaxID=157072 RepID=A0A024UKZ3_9STRA|nr:hypothetical protein H310_01757 [Aphanomyces invadans]ETW07121.1 hypothetical protein H310_01757 [Aphanomyces invadans]|eukprot:XP_008863214.1 hypothetical protein H310_01757 [Aphanomyces invadans]
MEEGDCTICLEPLLKELYALPCGHVFHGRCIVAALRSKKQCPQCRRQISSQEPIRLFFKVPTNVANDSSPSKSPSSPSSRRLDDVVANFETKLSLLRSQLQAMHAEQEASKHELDKWEVYGEQSQAAFKKIEAKVSTLRRANETLTKSLHDAKQSNAALEASLQRAMADTATLQFLNSNDLEALEADLANPAMIIAALKKANRFRMVQYEKVVQKLNAAKDEVNKLKAASTEMRSHGDVSSPRRKIAVKRPLAKPATMPAFNLHQSAMLETFQDVLPAVASSAVHHASPPPPPAHRPLVWTHRHDLKPMGITPPLSLRPHGDSKTVSDCPKMKKPAVAPAASIRPITTWFK